MNERFFCMRRPSVFLSVFLTGAFLLAGHVRPSYAVPIGACESSMDTNAAMKSYIEDMTKTFNDFIGEIVNFIDYDLGQAAKTELIGTKDNPGRLMEYDKNMYPALNDWWDDKSPVTAPTSTLPALKAMTQQLSVAKVAQTAAIGAFLDARLLNEKIRARQDAAARLMSLADVSELSCQAVSLMAADAGAALVSGALSRAFAWEHLKKRQNISQPSREFAGKFISPAYANENKQKVRAEEIRNQYAEYQEKFCDARLGDQGCKAEATPFPSADTDIAQYIFGKQQTFGADQAQQVWPTALRTLIDPVLPEPLIGSGAQVEELRRRRIAHDARVSAIYAVVGDMLGKRSAGSGVSTAGVKMGAGANPADPAVVAATNASEADIDNALTVERYADPTYAIRLANGPNAALESMVETGIVLSKDANALYDLLSRELVMQGSAYAAQLDASGK